VLSAQDDVRPDLVRHDVHVVLPEDVHGTLKLPALPYAAAWVVGGAQDRRMDLPLLDLALHVLEVHAPDAVLVPDEGTMDDVVAVVLDASREPDVGGGVEQDVVTLRTEHIERRHHAAQHAVLVPYALLGQAENAVSGLVPPDDRVEVLLTWPEVPIGRVLRTLDDRLGDGRHGGEVHVGNPHGDGIEALPGLHREGTMLAPRGLDRNGIHAPAINDAGEVIPHGTSHPFPDNSHPIVATHDIVYQYVSSRCSRMRCGPGHRCPVGCGGVLPISA